MRQLMLQAWILSTTNLIETTIELNDNGEAFFTIMKQSARKLTQTPTQHVANDQSKDRATVTQSDDHQEKQQTKSSEPVTIYSSVEINN